MQESWGSEEGYRGRKAARPPFLPHLEGGDGNDRFSVVLLFWEEWITFHGRRRLPEPVLTSSLHLAQTDADWNRPAQRSQALPNSEPMKSQATRKCTWSLPVNPRRLSQEQGRQPVGRLLRSPTLQHKIRHSFLRRGHMGKSL
jgi:hypothetical protein